jgi:thiol-disulfide isomerase/thioredoxin
MSKKTIVVLVILLTFASAIAFVFMNQDEATAPTASSTSTTAVDPAQANDTPLPAETSSAGVYTEYSEDALSTASGTKVLFFHASWCPQCRALAEDIQAKGVPAGVTILEVDYDTNQALRQKYGVTIQTTLVTVDDQGKLVKKFVAYDDPSLAAVQENLL